MSPLDLSHLSPTPPCFQPSAELLTLQELAEDVGSNVVILRDVHTKSVVVRVDGLEFPSIATAIAHCREVA